MTACGDCGSCNAGVCDFTDATACGDCGACDAGSCDYADHSRCDSCALCTVAGVCDTACDDGDVWTDNDICVADVCAGTLNESVIYALGESHPAATITNSGNLIKLYSVQRTDTGGWAFTFLEDLGSFKDSPQYWDTVYNTTDIPELCYDKSSVYVGTIWEGVGDRYFPAASKADLVQAVRDSVSDPYTWRWPSNSAGNDLCRSGNFWTQVLFTDAGADFLETRLTNY